MEKKQFEQTIESIKKLEKKLDILIAILKKMAPKTELGVEEKAILKLCNRKNTIIDMMQKTNKQRNNIQVTLSHLKSKGLIKPVTINDKRVYEKI